MKKQFLLFALLFILFLVLPGAYEKLREYMRRQNGDGLLPFSVPSQRNSRPIEPQPEVKHGFTRPFDNRLNSAIAFIRKIEEEANAGTGEKKFYYLNDLKEFCKSGENDPEIFLAILNNRYGVSDFCRGWAAAALGYLNDGNYTNALVNAYKSENSDTVRLAVLQGFLKISDAFSTSIKRHPLTYAISLCLQGEPADNLSPEALNCFVEEIDMRGKAADTKAAQLIDAIAPMQKTSAFLTFKLIEILADRNYSRIARIAATEAFAYSQSGIGVVELEQIVQKNSSENLNFEFDPGNRYHEAVFAAKALVAKIRAGDEMAKIEAKRIILGNVPPSVKETLLDFHRPQEPITPEDMALFLSLTNDASIGVRSRAVASVFTYSGDDPVVNEIVNDVIIKEKNPELKVELIKAVATAKAGSHYTQNDMGFFTRLLEGSEDDIVKKQVIESLRYMGFFDALPYIESIAMSSDSEALRKTAQDAIFFMTNESEEYSKYEKKIKILRIQPNGEVLKELTDIVYNGPALSLKEKALDGIDADSITGEAALVDVLKTSEDEEIKTFAFMKLLYSSNYGKNEKYLDEILKAPALNKSDFMVHLITRLSEGRKADVEYQETAMLSDNIGLNKPDAAREKNLYDFLNNVFETAEAIELKKAVIKAYQGFSDKETAAAITAKLNGLLEDETNAELKPDIRQALNWLKYNSGQ
ncbi:MAG: hypothetical protein HZA48_02860 [Planctomycetes bacterium]|nr:hypothetical protein [Planctomycetota bacterium]